VDAGDTGAITADPRKLKQIVSILSNAVKFTPAGARFVWRRTPTGAFAELPSRTPAPASARKAAENSPEFTQVDGSLSRRHEGTGLGLALTKRLSNCTVARSPFRALSARGAPSPCAYPSGVLEYKY